MNRATQLFQAGDMESFYETLTVAAFRNSRVSVTLANPNLPDCPLVGVSQGFEQMTGYSRSEILGRNCRFLNYNCHVPARVRHELRCATRSHMQFVGILMNRRKSGEIFQNLLHMSSLRVANSTYLLGVQADVTHSDVDLQEQKHIDELNRIVDAIFASNVNAWAALQALNYGHAKFDPMIPWYTEMQLVPRYQPQLYREARETFVSLAHLDSGSGTQLCCSNTFLEVRSEENPGERLTRLRMVSSEPALGLREAEMQDNLRLPAQVHRDSLVHLQPGSSPLPPREPPRRRMPQAENAGNRDKNVASKGSIDHPDGCTPCSFHCYSQMGCNRGESCAYCHMEHPKRTRRRGRRRPKGGADASALGPDAPAADEPKPSEQFPPPPATPANLMPLLGALELLSPLPSLRTLTGDSVSSSSPGPSQDPFGADVGGFDGDFAEDLSAAEGQQGGLSLQYNESSIVLVRAQWKQVLPFVYGQCGSPEFSVDPPLPANLILNRTTGVISGRAVQLTAPEGVLHIVRMHSSGGKAYTTINLTVVDSASGASSCNEGPLQSGGRPFVFGGAVSGTGTSEEE